MTQPPENGPDAETQPFGAVPPEPAPVVIQAPPPQPVAPAKSGSNTRTILEIVGAVVAVVAILAASGFGFALGWFAGSHNERSNDNVPRMMMRFDDGQGGGNGYGNDGQAPDLRDFFGGQGGDSNGNGGTQSMPDLPDDLQRLLEQFGQQFGEQFGQGQGGMGPGQGTPAPAPSAAPSS